ncbi:hypothetical protein BMR85_016810 [Achromobacter sp. KAs 3-5]|nr:hypothetical protein BMR85_016810 [Achromobacter sp. KAs 3-5]
MATSRFLLGMHVSPLPTASTHIHPDAMRTRKLLLKAEEISKLIGKVEPRQRRGCTQFLTPRRAWCPIASMHPH